MHSHELFLKMGAETARDILMYFRENERGVYKSAVASLTQKKNLRPVFVEKKSVPEQVAWMTKELTSKKSEEIAEQLLQVWLLQAQQPMLIKFLDAVEISHDGKGAVDDLPEEIDEAKAGEAVDVLLADFPEKQVAIYLHVFNAQRKDGWSGITSQLEKNPRLAL